MEDEAGVKKVEGKAADSAKKEVSFFKTLFTQDRIKMGSDPFGSDLLFSWCLHRIGSRWLYTIAHANSQPNSSHAFLPSLSSIIFL